MKKTRFTDEQIIGFLRQAEAGMPIKDIRRAGGFSQPTFYKWRSLRFPVVGTVAEAGHRVQYAHGGTSPHGQYPKTSHNPKRRGPHRFVRQTA